MRSDRGAEDSASVEDKTSIDDVIAKLSAAGHDDSGGAEILAAAITLRDSSGRDRKAALRSMATTWGVTLKEKIAGKYKHRTNEKLAEDLQASVCKAALEWELRTHSSQISITRSHSVADAEIVIKKARISGAAEHGSAVVTNASATVPSEHVSTSAEDKTYIDDVIAKLNAASIH